MVVAAFTSEQRLEIEGRIKQAFTPYAPISDIKLFRGRLGQVRSVADAISTSGLHTVIYGERGVGKTSLTNMLRSLLQGNIATCKVNCTQGDSFAAVIRRALDALEITVEQQPPGFESSPTTSAMSLSQMLPANGRLSPDSVATLLAKLQSFTVLAFDEFDRLAPGTKGAFADLVKGLSDRGATTTIVLVGVAEDINELVASHSSVERCLRQIRMPRMSDEEVDEIVTKGFEAAGFTYDSAVPKRIVSVAQGFPHYAHLLAQNAARTAVDAGRVHVNDGDVLRGMDTAVRETDQTHRDLYYQAVTGTRRQNLWREVVTACALAKSDERGYFATRDVQDSLSRILMRPVRQQTIAFHLGKLIEDSRGPLLVRTGPERRYRYRFMNPLMRPFVLVKAMADGLIRP